MEDSMIDMPNLVFDEKIGNKRVRDGEEEINTGRLEKRPSGILGVDGGGDCIGDGGDEGEESGGSGDRGGSGGIIDTLISNVFHKSEIGIKEDEDGGEVKKDVFDVEVEDKGDDLGGDGSGEGDSGGGGDSGDSGDGGGIINAFFSNIFHCNKSAESGGGGGGDNDGDSDRSSGDGGEAEDLNEEKLAEKNDTILDAKGGGGGGGQKLMKPDDYSERVFFLNNN